MLNLIRYYLLRGMILLAPGLLIACGSQPEPLPPPPSKPIIAQVAIPVPCEITQVPAADYPGRLARPGDDIFTLSKIIAADRKVRQGETAELRAANESPCK